MEQVLYGDLAIVGFNGIHDSADRESRRQPKISLYKRSTANGVRPGPVERVSCPKNASTMHGDATHAVSYTLSRTETVVVKYVPDPKTDMFQIGRSTNDNIDFVVSEPQPLRLRSHHVLSDREQQHTSSSSAASAHKGKALKIGKIHRETTPPIKSNHGSYESAVSRFACRIHIERDPPHTARIYAAGFDSSNKIVLGELAVKWKVEGQMDGLTTNGVMILRADSVQLPCKSSILNETGGVLDECDPQHLSSEKSEKHSTNEEFRSQWREVSIGGSVYEVREKRCAPTQRNKVDEDNVLTDKTLIDLCGVTLFWRSAAGLKDTIDTNQLQNMIDALNSARFQCPVMYHTLRLPHSNCSKRSSLSFPNKEQQGSHVTDNCISLSDTQSQPYVYLNCGHVHGWHTWLAEGDQSLSSGSAPVRTCSLCLQPSRFVPLRMGLESAFYIDRTLATHCFSPCGHMASEKTARFWCSLPLPTTHNFEFRPRCPFCFAAIDPNPVQLRFSGDVDSDTLLQSLNTTLTIDSCQVSESVAATPTDKHHLSKQSIFLHPSTKAL